MLSSKCSQPMAELVDNLSMSLNRWLLLLSTLLGLVPPIAAIANPAPPPSNASGNSVVSNSSNGSLACPKPALSRLIRHKVAPGESLESIAQRYNLIPATLIGMNPALRQGKVAVGSEIVIPPYNGIRVAVRGQTLRNVAATYKVRPDVLFEVNGCQTAPKVVFVPGVNWSPISPSVAVPSVTGYPLPAVANVALGYGWQVHPVTGKVFFNSGLDLLAATGTEVRAISAGTVAFAGEQGSYGNLVVVNHQGGRQSRYAHLKSVMVSTGQTVKQGDKLGTVGSTGKPIPSQPHLHFELRYASSLGWVAEDPASFLKRSQRKR